jgi:heme iron utilization protein
MSFAWPGTKRTACRPCYTLGMTTQHDAPGARQELLYDPNVPTPTPGERARTMCATLVTGTLCTIAREPAGYPYGSFVTVALDRGHPVFLISELAEHTRNLRADPRASFLFAEPGEGDPLARGRVTLLGPCRAVVEGEARDSARRAFLAAHPQSAYYVDFKDFAFWRLDVESVRWIGGYGRMSWVTREDWLAGEADPLAPHARGILEHMNEDHAETMLLYVRTFTRATDATAASMTGVDRYGFEMSATTPAGPRPIRLAFTRAIATPDEARQELVALAKRARAQGPSE